MSEPIRIRLTPEQSAQLQATGENAFLVALRRSYVPPDPATVGQWEIIATPANHRRAVAALNVFHGSHEARRIAKATTQATGHKNEQPASTA